MGRKKNAELSADADEYRITGKIVYCIPGAWFLGYETDMCVCMCTVFCRVESYLRGRGFTLRRCHPPTYLARVLGLTCDVLARWDQRGYFAYSAE